MRLLQRSLVARIIASLLAISAMAMAGILATSLVTNNSRGDASAINMAGSLRMKTYQIITALQHYQQPPESTQHERVMELSQRFLKRLDNPQLTNAISTASDHPLRQQYHLIQRRWEQELAPQINTVINGGPLESATLNNTLDSLVNDIDQLVTLLQQSSEAKIRLLSVLQLLFLGMTAAVLAASLYDLRHNLVTPLRQLVVLAREASRRNFRYRTQLTGSDELVLLSRTFDAMAEELGSSYAELEASISHKQQELELSNRVMQLLHDGSRSLYGGGNDLCSGATPMLRRLEKLLGLGPIRLSLHDSHAQRQLPILATHSPTRPVYCRDHRCHACLIDPLPAESMSAEHAKRLLLPISIGEQLLGTLEIWYPDDHTLSGSTRRLLNILADQLATAIYLQQRIEKQQQASLINERTIIARELHDSLAQSLSYLKMQVARLERMQTKQVPREVQASVIGELRGGLNSAYRQLRELLTTFRLKLEGSNLRSALQQTIEEFTGRMGMPIELHYEVPPHLLNPNEEIHVLQIVREALANIHKHANAHWAAVTVHFTNARILLQIDDDGIGLTTHRSPPMHYGLVIMSDRAQTLGGELALAQRESGGTRVAVVFTPQTARLIQHQPKEQLATSTAEYHDTRT